MKEPTFILLGIIIILGLAWDPIKKGALQGPIFTNSGTSSFDYYPNSTTNEKTTTETKPVSEKQVSQQIANTAYTAEQLQKKLEEEEAKKRRSPLYGKIRLSHISYLNNPDPSNEYITLYTNINQEEKINITGWRLQSERSGNWIKIGKASVLPFPFSSSQNSDVILQQGDTAYLVKGFSPIGISFRTNKCTGYFGENRTFYPYIGRYCPSPYNEKLPQFSNNLDRDDECKDLIRRIPACTTAKKTYDFRDLPDTVTQICKDYMETKFTYNTCVSEHFGDTDFPGREWYVYLNIFGPLWRDKREHLILYDTSGLIVSELEY